MKAEHLQEGSMLWRAWVFPSLLENAIEWPLVNFAIRATMLWLRADRAIAVIGLPLTVLALPLLIRNEP